MAIKASIRNLTLSRPLRDLVLGLLDEHFAHRRLDGQN
jgi:hypothetical protein